MRFGGGSMRFGGGSVRFGRGSVDDHSGCHLPLT